MKKAILIFTLFFYHILQSQNCGSMVLNSSADSNDYIDDLRIYDRFGNQYKKSDLLIEDNPNYIVPGSFLNTSNKCVVGMFTLHFANETNANSRFAIAKNREVVCDVFRDLNELLFDKNPITNNGRVHIYICSDQTYLSTFGTSLPSSALGVGTFYSIAPIIPNIVDGEVYKSIISGTSPINVAFNDTTNQYYQCTMAINFQGINWNNDDTIQSIPNSQFDLYSVVLHEAFHILGIASNINDLGNSEAGGQGTYYRWDKFLFRKNDSIPLISYTPTNQTWSYTGGILPSNLFGCLSPNDVTFKGSHLLNELIYTSNPWSSGSSLSHIGCSVSGSPCNDTVYNNYVMKYCSASGKIVRRPHWKEVLALCDLGYPLRIKSNGKAQFGISTTNPTTYQEYNNCAPECIAIGQNDNFTTAFNTPVNITFKDLLKNDIYGDSIKDIVLSNPASGTIIKSTQSITFVPVNNFFGVVYLLYYPKCKNSFVHGSATYVSIEVLEPPTLPLNYCTTNSCNLVCFGNFEVEDYRVLKSVSSNLNPNINKYPQLNTVDAYRKTGSLFKRSFGLETPFKYSTTYNLTSSPSASSNRCNYFQAPPPISSNDGETYLGIISFYNSYREAVNLRLKKTITKGSCNHQFKLNAEYDGCSASLLIYGSSKKPCTLPNSTKFMLDSVSISDCGSKNYLMAKLDVFHNHNVVQWPAYTFNIVDSVIPDSGLNYITIVASNIDSPSNNPTYVVIDNVQITGDCDSNKLMVTSTIPNNTPCIGSSFSITYNVALKPGKGLRNTKPLVFKPILPDGFSVISASPPLNSGGLIIIEKDSLSVGSPKNIVVTLTSNINTAIVGKTYLLNFDIINEDACVDVNSSNQIGVKLITQPVYINYTADNLYPRMNEPVVHFITVCNNSNVVQNNVEIRDTLDPIFVIDSAPGLNINGNIVWKIMNFPASSSKDTCYTFKIYTRITYNCSNIGVMLKNSVHSNILGAVCPKPLAKSLNFEIPYKVRILLDDSVYCFNKGKLTADVNAEGMYTFEWFRNGSAIPNSNKDEIILDTPGVYKVVVFDTSGCITTSDSIKVKQVLKSNLNFTFDCYQSSIYPAISGGYEPHTYFWSDSSSSKERYGLTGDKYSVTITDSKGCRRVDSIQFGINTIGSLASPPCSTLSNAISSNKVTASYYWQGGGNVPPGSNQKLRINGDFYINTTFPYYFMPGTEIYMMPGSKIIVPSGKSVTFYGCSIKGCDSMWKGIEVENNGTLTMGNSTIEDALYAIEVKQNANIGIFKTKFKNNYLGLFANSSASNNVSIINSTIPMTDDTFLLEGNLKPKYAGMLVSSGIHSLDTPIAPFAGIHIQNVSYFYMGYSGETNYQYLPWQIDDISNPNNSIFVVPGENYFSGLQNGVVAINTKLKVEKSIFKNITNPDYTPNLSVPYYDTIVKGYGLYCFTDLMNNPFGQQLIFYGDRENYNSFDNCSRSIFTKGYSCEIANTKFGYGMTAIEIVVPPTNGTAYVGENTIAAEHAAIKLLNGGKNSFQILNNDISVLNLSPHSAKYIASGIRVMEPSTPSPTVFCISSGNQCDVIANNNITLTGEVFYGIYTSNTKNVGINNNIINLENSNFAGPSEILGGISNNASTKIETISNVINGYGRLQSTNVNAQQGLFPVGLYNFSTTGIHECNSIAEIRTGMRYTGLCQNTSISKTSFTDNFTGLRVDASATLPPQRHKGNKWYNSFDTAAVNHNSLVNVGGQIFYIKSGSPIEMKPHWITGWVIPSSWFQTITTAIGDSDRANCTIEAPLMSPLVNPLLSELDSLIMKDSFYFNEFVIEQRLENREILYEKFKEVMSLYNNNAQVTNFMNNSDTNGTAAFYALERAILDSLHASISIGIQMTLLKKNKDDLITFITSLDSLKLTDTSSLIQTYCNNQLTQARIDLNNIEHGIDSIEAVYKAYRNAKLAIIEERNDTVPIPEIFFEYEQAVNEIYLNTIAQGNLKFTNTQINDLTAIANSCPLINGEAVFRARNLLSMIRGDKYYNDKVICNAQGYAYKRKPLEKEIQSNEDLEFQIFPNPAQDKLTIRAVKKLKGNIEFVFNDLLGREVNRMQRAELNSETILELKNIPQGAYVLSILREGITQFKTKIYVQP